MIRNLRPLFVGLALLAATAGQAQSQYYYPYGYGYNGYGFGGWGGTVQGNILQGMGAFAEGAGVYNYDTATANSINVDSYIRLNQYIWNSELEARTRWAAHQAKRLNLSRDEYKARLKRIRTSPTDGDIDSGEALNAILHDFTDPRFTTGSSGLRLASGAISARAVREIPFRDETDAITLSLDELTEPKSWPQPLLSDTFKPEREAYQKAVDDALAEDKEGGTLKPETIAKVRTSVAALYNKVEATIPKTQQPDHLQATNYLKGLAGLSRMLERPNVESVLSQLEKIENTSVGNLVAFMHTYNLRFAQATTPRQREVYRELYPIMAKDRDKVVGNPGDVAEPTPAARVDAPTALFYGVDPNHLHPKTPAPPAPTTPPKP
jgi:hypothetical protein